MRRTFTRCLGIAALMLSGLAALATPALPKPFVATYAVTFRGLNGGTLRMELRPDNQPQRYILETRANPSVLARLVISSDAFERTTLELTSRGLRPLLWELDDGKSGNKGDGRLEFDWTQNVVSGTYEGKPVRLPLEADMQDRLSIQLGVMTSLMRGQEPGTIAMVNGDSIRHYTYERKESEKIQSQVGELETIVYESTRPNSSRVSRVWHAPKLDYLAARAEQVRKGKIETVMTLTELKTSE